MSESDSNRSRIPLNVISPNAKVEQLRQQAAAQKQQGVEARLSADDTLISRFLDASKTPKQKAIIEKVIESVRQVYDPEIPVNIYDLGLIYDIDVHPETNSVKIKMTLTAPGCPVAAALVSAVETAAENVDEVPSASVELTFDPPWERSMMSEAAQLELGLL
jgi:FeS assembly SUF system protein